MTTPNSASEHTPVWKRFLTPGWFFSLLLVVIFSYFCFTFFAPWQLGKDHDLVERNEQIRAAYTADPVPLEQVAPIEDGDQWTRVMLTGHFIPEDEVLLRLRPVTSGPAYHSLTPFKLNSGETVLVNRGFVPAAEGNHVPDFPAPPEGEITTTGMVQLSERPSDREPLTEDGFRQVYSINSDDIEELTEQELIDGYVHLSADQPGVLNPIPVPSLDRGTHLSYGLQWLAFGFLAPAALLYFVYSEIRERRNLRREEVEMTSPAPVQPRRSRSVEDRYGQSKPDHYAKFEKRYRQR